MPKPVKKRSLPKQPVRGLPVHRGAGVLIPVKKRGKTFFLFTIERPVYWEKKRGKVYVNYTSPGGRSEPGEKEPATARRETLEEINCPVRLKSAKETIIRTRNGRTRTVASKTVKPAPIAIYSKQYSKVRYPVQKRGQKEQWIGHSRVYVGELKGKPKPASEIPAIILLPEELIAQTLKKPVNLETLLKNGAELIERRKIPKNAMLRPLYTPEILGEITKGKLSKFLEKI